MQTNLIIEPPNEKQKLFLLDHHRVVGFGGARGGGKSWVFRAKAKLLALKHSGITIVIVRKTYPELTQNHIEPLCNELNVYSKERLARYSDKDKTLRFDNGSRIIFRYCDTEKDADRFQGLECDVLMIDEATQITEEQYKKISATVRGVNAFPKRIYLSCNPAGAGHGLNLQAGGNIIVWYGLTWSLELYQQANARLYRQGQQNTVIIHHLITEGTCDERVLNSLQGKANVQEDLLKSLKAKYEK